jgi:hypothetical protein
MKERYAKPLPAVVLGGAAAAALMTSPLASGEPHAGRAAAAVAAVESACASEKDGAADTTRASVGAEGPHCTDGDAVPIADGPCPETDLGSALPVRATGSTTGAGNHLEGFCGGGSAPERTFRWTAPAPGTYVISTFGSNFDTVLSVRDDTCTGPELACNDDTVQTDRSSKVELVLAAGQSVVVVVDGYRASSGWFALYIDLISTARCPETELYHNQVAFGTTTDAASIDRGSCGGAGAPERTFRWSAPTTGTYAISTFGSSFDTVLYVRDGTCEGAELACNDDAVEKGWSSQVEVTLVAGQSVVIVVDGYSERQHGYFQLLINRIPVPPCPEMDLASQLPVSVRSTTRGADKALEGPCGGGGSPERSFRWTAPATGRYLVSTLGSSLDTVLYLRDHTCDGPELACNDDAPGFGRSSQVEVVLAAGQTIVIVVDGYGDNLADKFELQIRRADFEPPTPTPRPCQEIELGSTLPLSLRGTTTGAKNELGGSCGGGGSPERAFRWTAPATGSYFISTCGSSFDTVLHVRDGTCGGAELGCNDDAVGAGLSSELEVTLVAGQTVVIVVDGYRGRSGDFALRIVPGWELPPCPGDCNDDGEVTIDELVMMASVSLGATAACDCSAGDTNGDGEITIEEIMQAVDRTLNGC